MKYTIHKSITEQEIVEMVDAFLRKSGYRVIPNLRIRTWRPDIVGTKENELVIVEAKGHESDLRKAFAQTALYSTDATSAYLALPMERVQHDVKEAAKILGIGIIGVDEEVRVVVQPSSSTPRPYLLRRIRTSRKRSQERLASRSGRKSSVTFPRLIKHRRLIESL